MTTAELNSKLSEAWKLLANKAYIQSEKIYEEVLVENRDNATAKVGLSIVYNCLAKPEKALQILEPLIEKNDTKSKKILKLKADSIALLDAQMGISSHLLGKRKEALKYFKKANKLKPSPELNYIVNSLKESIDSNTKQQKIIKDAKIYLNLRRFNEAQYILTKGLEQYPSEAPLLYQVALFYKMINQTEKALSFLQQAIIIDPEKPIYYNDLGMVFQELKNYKKAIGFYKRALAKKPDYTIALNNLGVAYKKLDMIDEAIEAYQEALKIDPNLAPVHNNLGNLLRLTGKKEEAINHLKKALELNPNYNDAKQNLASILNS